MWSKGWIAFVLWSATSCGGGDLYAACESPEDCGEIVPEDAEAACIEKEGGGFCTWACAADDECGGDGDEEYDYVCASFEDTTGLYCFPACEGEEEECPSGYGCRSTGGGVDNRKVCFPT